MLSISQQFKETRRQCTKARAWVDKLPNELKGKKKLIQELDDIDAVLWQLIYQEVVPSAEEAT